MSPADIHSISSTCTADVRCTCQSKAAEARNDTKRKRDVITPVKSVFGLIPNIAANSEPISGENRAIYTNVSIR
jgi:hypothetical protein